MAQHPLAPHVDPSRVRVYEFHWQLRSSPAQLWPFVSNTERLNRAIGLPSPTFAAEWDGSRVRRFATFRKAGLTSKWEEHPFEWIEGRRMGILRTIERGPLEWLLSAVELTPRADGGTNLKHRFEFVPRGWLGRLFGAAELGYKARRGLDRVYRACDEAIQRGRIAGGDDPFQPGRGLSAKQRRHLDGGLVRLGERGVAPAIVERLDEYLTFAPDQAVTRIRPLAVAEQLALDPHQFVDACLHGAREGLLAMLWDILCPVCRIPSQVQDSLRAISDHGRCEACHLDFELDFANSVELIFRVDPRVRPSELGVYCIGGPAHSPHVAAQLRVNGGERVELALDLGEGSYRFRGPQLAYTIDFRVTPQASAVRWDLMLSRRPGANLARSLRTGGQTFALTNDTTDELIVRVERTAPRTDALTAARASSLKLFRELFPGETLAPGRLVSVAEVTLLATELEGIQALYREQGDAAAFGVLHEYQVRIDELVRREGGAVINTVDGLTLATFPEPANAVRAALGATNAAGGRAVRSGVHRGPAYSATVNERLDFFGATVNGARRLPRLAPSGGTALSRPIATDGVVVEMLKAAGIELRVLNTSDAPGPEPFVYIVASR